MKHIKILIFLLLVIVAETAVGQVALVLNSPNVGVLPKASLWNMTIVNGANNPEELKLRLTLRNRANNAIMLDAESGSVTVPGNSTLIANMGNVGGVTVLAIDPSLDNMILLPVGVYQLCVAVESIQKGKFLTQSCQYIDCEALMPPHLVVPSDTSILTNQNVFFSWLPPAPTSMFSTLAYDLLVAEQLPGQTALEAIQRNTPVIAGVSLNSTSLLSSELGVTLDTSKKYVWQVVARSGNVYAGKSELWSFQIKKNNASVANNLNGKFYTVLGADWYAVQMPVADELLLLIDNARNASSIKITVSQSTANGSQVVQAMKRDLVSGHNYINWKADLSNAKAGTLILLAQFSNGDKVGCLIIK